jgi:tRNA G46 methylase TrmB
LPKETKVIFQTDQKELFRWTKKLIKEDGSFKVRRFFRPPWGIRTYWEEMKIKEGKRIYRLSFNLKKKG